MLAWNEVYRRIRENPSDFMSLFGRTFRQDEFRPYSYAVKFDNVPPGLLSSGANPNVGSLAFTRANIAAPPAGSNQVYSAATSAQRLDFPAGAIVLGITAAASFQQQNPTVSNNIPPDTVTTFQYGPGNASGSRDLFVIKLTFADTAPVTDSNPIPELTFAPTYKIQTAPPFLVEAFCGQGQKDISPFRELYVTPGLGLLTTVRSLVMADVLPEEGTPQGGLSAHVVFHCMVPGIVRANENN